MREMDSHIFEAKGKKSKGMGRGRAPCCDKIHVNRGPWSPAEDLRLISFIQKYGHDNWRALPKQAGLLRCGKSCRLRWVNYLRPDLKRGNFSKEEEESIIQLHRAFGNKWSRIAAYLPGRTDNEIKNVWNTHLKKKLAQTAGRDGINKESYVITTSSSSSSTVESNQNHQKIELDSQINMLPHFSVMRTAGQTEFNFAPMANQMGKLHDSLPFNDFNSMSLQHSEQFLDSNGITNQLENFTMWQDPNPLDSLLNLDEDPNWGLPIAPPNIQLDPTENNPSHELDVELPDFDLWSMLNYDVVSAASAKPDEKETDNVHTVETLMSEKNMNAANEYITDKDDIDSLLESLDNFPELSPISKEEMCEKPKQYQGDVPKSSSPATVSGVSEMLDMDYFPMWTPSPI